MGGNEKLDANQLAGLRETNWGRLLLALGQISLAEWIQIILAFLALCGSFSFGAWFQKWRARRLMRNAREAAEAESVPSVFLPKRHEHYLDQLASGIGALDALPDSEKLKIQAEIGTLVHELRKTHATLHEAMNVLEIETLTQFTQAFGAAHDRIRDWVVNRRIAGDVRTRCHEAAAACFIIAGKLPEPQAQTMRDLGTAMYEADEDAIVPLMLHLLSTVWYDLWSIKYELDHGSTALALRIKERARQRLRPVHERITAEIDAMDKLLGNVTRCQ